MGSPFVVSLGGPTVPVRRLGWLVVLLG